MAGFDAGPGSGRPIKARRGRRRADALLFVLLAVTGAGPVAAVDLGAAWTGDFGTVVDGGLRQDSRALGMVELTLDHELAALRRDWNLHVSAQHVYGGGFSERWVGDLQGVSNVDADHGTRVLQAWFAVPLTPALALKAGRYDFNSEFDAIETAGLFLSSSQGIGPDISQTGAAGPSIFPRTALGLRLELDLDRPGRLRAVGLDVEADEGSGSGRAPFAGGSMVAFEYERDLGGDPRATVLKAGAWSFTGTRTAVEGPGHEREYGAYASAEFKVEDRWSLYARAGAANEDASRIGWYLGAGVVRRDVLLPGRDDELGVAVAHARNGGPYREAMRRAGQPTTAAETAVELTWRVPVGEHLALQPDLQYVFDPDTDPAIEDALVFLLRVDLAY